MVTSCTFEEMTLFLQSGCKTNSLWTFLIISETHHVPPDFEIYVEWYLSILAIFRKCVFAIEVLTFIRVTEIVQITPNTTYMYILLLIFKPGCWEPPGHYLCTLESERLGCIISIQKGVNDNAYPVTVSQKVTKILPVSFYSPTPGFKWKRFIRDLESLIVHHLL